MFMHFAVARLVLLLTHRWDRLMFGSQGGSGEGTIHEYTKPPTPAMDIDRAKACKGHCRKMSTSLGVRGMSTPLPPA